MKKFYYFVLSITLFSITAVNAQLTTCPITFTNVVTVNHPGCYGANFEIDFTVTTGGTAIYGVQDLEEVFYGMDMPYYVIVYRGGGSSWTSIGALGPFKYVQNLFDAVTGVEMVGGISGTAGCSYTASFKLKALMPLNVSNNDTYRFGISYNLYPERDVPAATPGFKKSALIMLENTVSLVAETQSTGQRTLVDSWAPPFVDETGSIGGCGNGSNQFSADSVYPNSAAEWFGGFGNYSSPDPRDFEISINETKSYKIAAAYKDILPGGGCMTRLSNIKTVNIVEKPRIQVYKPLANQYDETILSNGEPLQMLLTFNSAGPWNYQLDNGTSGICYGRDTIIIQNVSQQDEAPMNYFGRTILYGSGDGCTDLEGTGGAFCWIGNITPQNIATEYCGTATDSIHFIANYNLQDGEIGWNGENKFAVEMSDASGNNFTPIDCNCIVQPFEEPDLGDTVLTKGACAFTIPTNYLPGSGYRLRVVQRNQLDIYFGDTTILVMNVNGTATNSFTLSHCIQTPANNNCNSSTKSNIPLNTWQHFENNGSVLASVNTLNNDLGAIEMQMQYYPVSSPPSAGAIIFMNRYFDFVCNGGADCATDGIFPNGPVQVRLYFTQAELDAHTGIVNSNPSLSALGVVHNMNAVLPDCTPVNNGNAVVTEIIQGAGVQYVPYANGYYAEFSLNSFSEVGLSNSFGVVPVTLISFTANCNATTATLNWSTSSEINSFEFGIEKSRDGSNWQSIKNIPAQGQSNAVVKYQYTDAAYNGNSLYRIKMIDRDGTFTYSYVVSLSCGEQPVITVTPNPFDEYLKFKYTAKQKGQVSFQLFGMDGRIALEQNKVLQQGLQTIEINTAPLSTGMYVLIIKNRDGLVSHTPIIKKKN